MQSPTRNPYDIVTEGIISTIPVKFRLQSYVKHYPQTNFPKLPSNFNISRNIINLLLITSDRMNYIILRNPQLFSVLSKLLCNHQPVPNEGRPVRGCLLYKFLCNHQLVIPTTL